MDTHVSTFTKEAYNNLPLYFWSNSVCELYNPHVIPRDDCWNILDGVEDLPEGLRPIFENIYREASAGRAYLTEFDGKYGILYECEYYERTENGELGEVNNYARAVQVAEEAKKEFPFATVFVAKESGEDWFYEGDFATLLNIFIEDKDLSVDVLDHVENWISENAWDFGC